MFQKIKNIIKKTFLYDIIKYTSKRKRLREWDKKGKVCYTRGFGETKSCEGICKKFSIRILIEAGTYLGDMIDAAKNAFGKIISIEEVQDLIFKKHYNWVCEIKDDIIRIHKNVATKY